MSVASNIIRLKTDEALLDAAESLFAERGFSAVSTRDIADRAGVNLGSIQYHFGSKSQLFIATVHRLMSRSLGSGDFRAMLESHPVNQESSALILADFISLFLREMCTQQGPRACRMMYREALGETSAHPEMFEALVSSVVHDFSRPLDLKLRTLINQITPNLQETELDFIIQSIIGQCSFYFTHRPFVERLRDVSVSDTYYIETAAQHVVKFTLRALGCDDTLIEHAKSHISYISQTICPENYSQKSIPRDSDNIQTGAKNHG